ncbi:hypothetical protein [Streptantibioticus silvisoli]|uniref:TlpA family protein disulfide reductase n=1 Tax=Streptantibioticus silvisoli TaxID=2705255 RepID=A0ABT6W3R6_9ACTN|nr:hypothetical protein [Streptantibioticus silvisoli]MDI5965393.1 hypothetical protein [Streptantibioticus silvisoli]
MHPAGAPRRPPGRRSGDDDLRGRGGSSRLNTPDGKPLGIKALHGKVVLIHFWTYSCINCQRSLPHVEAWDRAYRSDGLQVSGVPTLYTLSGVAACWPAADGRRSSNCS